MPLIHNLVRQFLMTIQRRDTLSDLSGGLETVSCHFTRQMRLSGDQQARSRLAKKAETLKN
jgi:hypothetical protein